MSGKQWSIDSLAALVTTVSLIPGIVVICNLVGIPPVNGLLSLVIAIVATGFFSQVSLQVNAPTISLAVICMACISAHGLSGLCLATLLAGFLQLVLGFTKSGRYFRIIPLAALKGIMAGIGIAIIVNRLPVLVGSETYTTLWQNGISSVGPASFGIGSLLLIFMWSVFPPKRWTQVLPAIPMVVLAMIIVSISIGADATQELSLEYVFPFAELPKAMGHGGIVFYGLSLAFVSSLKSLLTTSKIESLTDHSYDLDRELLITGAANLTCGFLGALPISAQLGRSIIQIEIGAKGKSTTFMQLAWITVIIAFGMKYLNFLPTETMAAILIYCGFMLIDFKFLNSLRKFGRGELILAITTATFVVFMDIQYGVIAGLLITMFRLSATLSADLSITLQEPKSDQDPYRLKLSGAVTFLNLPKLYEHKEKLPRHSKIIVDTDSVYYFDQACIAFFVEWQRQMQPKGGSVVINFIDLLTRSQYPDKQKEYILSELRNLDRRKASRNDSMGRRAIDKVIYGDKKESNDDELVS